MTTTGILLLTFRELWAKKITLGLLIVCTLAWVLMALALRLDIVEGTMAGIRIFGQDAGTPSRAVEDPETGEFIRQALSLNTFVLQIEAFITGVAYWLGTLLGLFATAPLLTSLQERGRIDLLLSKPLSRSHIFMGHLLGVWLTVLILAAYLFGLIWIILGYKTGIWHARFLLAIPLVTGMFAVMYSVVLLLGVVAHSTALSLISAYGLIFVSLFLAAKDELAPQINPPWRQIYLGFYHTLPNFAEITALTAKLSQPDAVLAWYPLISSLAFGVVLYVAAHFWFLRKDF